MNEELLEKKKLIDKYFSKTKSKLLFDILFINIDNITLYIRLDLMTKANTFRLFWINLTAMNTKKVEDWVNTNLMYPSLVERFKNIMVSNRNIKDFIDKDKIDSKVIINSYFTDYETNARTFEFKRYIPKCWDFLADALFIIFDGMPRYLYPIFQIVVEKLIDPGKNCVFVFDLKKDKIDNIFDPVVISKGKEYYEHNKIVFIEKQDNTTYSVIKGTKDYVVSIISNNDTKEVQFTCDCEYPHLCKHIYATLLAMNKKEEKKFYKIAYVDSDKNIMDNIKNFSYFFCADIYEDYFVVIENNTFRLYPIIENNKLNFRIIEDDDKKYLERKLKAYLKKIDFID